MLHGLSERLPIFSLLDGIKRSPNQFYSMFFKNPTLGKIDSKIQCSLPSHGWKKGIRFFLSDDSAYSFWSNRFNVSSVHKPRIGHDRCGVAVYQDYSVPLILKGFAGLGAAIIKFTGLTNYDRAGTNQHDRFDVGSFWH